MCTARTNNWKLPTPRPSQIKSASGILLLVSATIAFAQVKTSTKSTVLPVGNPAQMSAQEFEQWVSTQAERLEVMEEKNDRQNGDALVEEMAQALYHRLQSGRQTTNVSVISVVSHYEGYESSLPSTRNAPPASSMEKSKRLLTNVLALMYGRPELQGQLLQRRGELFADSNNEIEALKDLEDAARLLSQAETETERHRLESQLEAADVHLLKGRKKQADDLYMQVLSYPWYNLQDPEQMQVFRDLYVRAGGGLITTRFGNLAALKELDFAPATWRQLKGRLNRAIRAAGGTP